MKEIITVSREFGSGGRELGKRLADALDYAYYDREIVTTLAAETGMDPNYLDRKLDQGSLLASYPIHYAQSFNTVPDTATSILTLQTRLIRKLAENGRCVIVGRAADVLLEDEHPFRLFVYADQASKLARCRSRAAESENLSDKEMLRQMKRIDKARAEFHDILAETPWGERLSYDLGVNTSGLDIRGIVPSVAEYYRNWLRCR